jgi:hypothetical protein
MDSTNQSQIEVDLVLDDNSVLLYRDTRQWVLLSRRRIRAPFILLRHRQVGVALACLCLRQALNCCLTHVQSTTLRECANNGRAQSAR